MLTGTGAMPTGAATENAQTKAPKNTNRMKAPSRSFLLGGRLMDLNEIARTASQSQNQLVELQDAVRQLQARVDRHALVIQVLKDMLLSGAAPTEDAFLDRLEQAAAQKPDGRTCRKCGRAMSPRHTRCMYCGEARPAELL